MNTANQFDMGIRLESDRVIYLAEVSESESLAENIRVKIDVICGGGVVEVPVRIIEPISNNISALEQVVSFGLATKQEFRALKRIANILNQN